MKISIIGTGYVGLVTGTCLSEVGHDTCCVDIDPSKIERLNNGIIPIYEPKLEDLLTRNQKAGRLKFTTSLEEGLTHGDVIFLALPTPEGADGAADMRYVLQVAEDIGKSIKSYKVIVNKSTVPVGTADKVKNIIAKHTDTPFDVVSNPEFLREGVAVADFMNPDRIVIGASTPKAIDCMQTLYAPFTQKGNLVMIMDERSAELTKYAANSFLATKITFMNELANLCEKLGADVDQVREGIGADERIGNRFLFPGIGYGGSCFPKDVKALENSSQEADYDFKLLRAVVDVNDRQKTILFDKIQRYFSDLKDKQIAIWGLAFKPETDDIREAPSLYMIDKLLAAQTKLTVFDPEAMQQVQNKYGTDLRYAENMYDTLKDADALLIFTEWSMFKTPDFKKMAQLMNTPVIFDGRNIFDPKDMKTEGFYYESIGRPDNNCLKKCTNAY